MSSALVAPDVKVFRHEFITIFRYSHTACVHPADFRVLYTIDDQCALHDEEKETVYLTKDVMDQLQKLMMMAASSRHAMRRSRGVAPPAASRTMRAHAPTVVQSMASKPRVVSFVGR